MKAQLIWITGLSGCGKTTIGRGVYTELKKNNPSTVFLDGDNFRQILGNDLGHTNQDRLENAKRISRMCQFLTSQNINVVCATMSLYSEIHQLNREKIKNYIEIYIHCEIKELIKRDQKGLYSKSIQGDINNVVGLNLPFDKPDLCELIIDNSELNHLSQKVHKIITFIKDK